PIKESPLLEGKVEKIPDDLGIFSIAYDKDNKYQPFAVYYKAGVFTRGKYKGYQRIVLTTTINAPGSTHYVLATNDNKTYILDISDDQKTYYDTPEKLRDYGFNPDKISKIDKIDTEHQDSLSLDSRFGLYKKL